MHLTLNRSFILKPQLNYDNMSEVFWCESQYIN